MVFFTIQYFVEYFCSIVFIIKSIILYLSTNLCSQIHFRLSAKEERKKEEMVERADVSEVIEVRGHPGRKSHESRASGCEQCYRALYSLFFDISFRALSSSLFASSYCNWILYNNTAFL